MSRSASTIGHHLAGFASSAGTNTAPPRSLLVTTWLPFMEGVRTHQRSQLSASFNLPEETFLLTSLDGMHGDAWRLNHAGARTARSNRRWFDEAMLGGVRLAELGMTWAHTMGLRRPWDRDARSLRHHVTVLSRAAGRDGRHVFSPSNLNGQMWPAWPSSSAPESMVQVVAIAVVNRCHPP